MSRARARRPSVRCCRWCKRDLPSSHFARGRKGCLTCLEGAPLPAFDPPVWPPYAAAPDAPCPVCRRPMRSRTCAHHTYCSPDCRRRAARLRAITARTP